MTDPIWKLDRVTLHGDRHPRLDAVSLELNAGTTAILGHSGAGKTSLLNVLAGFEPPDSGSIERLLHRDESQLPLFWVPQNDGLWPHLTALEHLAAVSPRDKSPDEHTEFLAKFDLAKLCESRPDVMSRGERSRLSLARAMASEAAVLVLDEPLSHVDPARVNKYWDVLSSHLRHTGTSAVIATHSPETVLRESTQVVCMDYGKTLWHGDIKDLYWRPNNEQLALMLGPVNWIPAKETHQWLGSAADNDVCFRPEQIEIVPSEDSPLVVESSRFSGSSAEVDLRDERDSHTRRFHHRPSGNSLTPGNRVVIRKLLTLICLLGLFSGCEPAANSVLNVRDVKYWAMPADGRRLPAPRGVTATESGDVYVLDNAARVLVFNAEGNIQRQWKMPDSSAGNPEGICLFQDGRVAVADTHYHRVVFFDETGEVLSTLGSLGKEPGQFIYPVAITQDDAENFYVAEYGSNDRIQKFSKDGELLLQFGGFGTGDGEFQRPSGIVWRDKKTYIADAMNHRIQVFSDEGKFLEVLRLDETSEPLDHPYGITLGANDDLFVVEYGAGRFARLSLSGKLLGRFGSSGRGEAQFSTPWGLAVTRDGNVVVADTGNRRLVELRF